MYEIEFNVSLRAQAPHHAARTCILRGFLLENFMTKHTPEPWVQSSDDFVVAESDQLNAGEYILSCFGPDKAANARRIVACVNAMRGVPTEELERHQFGHAGEVQFRIEITNQRDELLAALDDITKIKWRDGLAGIDRPTDFAERESAIRALGSAMTIARTAISKVKGV